MTMPNTILSVDKNMKYFILFNLISYLIIILDTGK